MFVRKFSYFVVDPSGWEMHYKCFVILRIGIALLQIMKMRSGTKPLSV